MKICFSSTLFKPIYFISFLIFLFFFKGDLAKADYLAEEFEIDTSTKSDEASSTFPTNPFEIVEMMRKYNSLNDATNPSDAIDNALESFKIEED